MRVVVPLILVLTLTTTLIPPPTHSAGLYPDPPTSVTITSSSPTTLSLSWILPTYAGPAGTSLQSLTLTAIPTPPSTAPTRSLSLVTDSLTAYTLTALQPGTEYAVTLSAHADSGRNSPPSSPPAVGSTLPSPPQAPTGLASPPPPSPIPGNRGFTLSWLAPGDTGSSNGSPLPLSAYQIAYEPAQGPAAGDEVVIITPDAASTLATLTAQVLPGTEYVVTVAAINSLGLVSDFADPPLLVAIPIGPPDPPSLIQVQDASHVLTPLPPTGNSQDVRTYSAALSFVTPLATGSADYSIAAYNVSISRISGPGSPEPHPSLHVPVGTLANPESIPIQALQVGTQYQVSILSINSVGVASAPSPPYQWDTPVGPPSGLRNLLLTPPSAPGGETSLLVSWNAPLSTGGVSLGLANVSLTLIESVSGAVVGQNVVSGGLVSTTFSGLNAGTSYTISGFATNDAGISSVATAANGATLIGSPATLTGVAVVQVGEAYVSVQFDTPTQAQLGGPLTSLASITLSLQGGAGAVLVPAADLVPGPTPGTSVVTTQFTSLRLSPLTAYTGALAVSNADGGSSPTSLAFSFTTAPWGTDTRVRVLSAVPVVLDEATAPTPVVLSLVLAAPAELGTSVTLPLSLDEKYGTLSSPSVTFPGASWNVPIELQVTPTRSSFAVRGPGPEFASSVALDLQVGPTSVSGGVAPPSPASAFFVGYSGPLSNVLQYTDADSVGINATASLEGGNVLVVFATPTSVPASPLTLAFSSSSLSGALASVPPLTLPGETRITLSGAQVSELESAGSTIEMGMVTATGGSSGPDGVYQGMSVTTTVSGLSGPSLASAAPSLAEDESVWDKYLALWILLILAAAICVILVLVWIVLKLLAARSERKGGSNAVAPSPEPSPRDHHYASNNSNNSGIGMDIVDESSMVPISPSQQGVRPGTPEDPELRRSVLSTGARRLPPLRATPARYVPGGSGSGFGSDHPVPGIAGTPVLLALSPGRRPSPMGAPVVRGVSPAFVSSGRSGPMRYTTPPGSGGSPEHHGRRVIGGMARDPRSPDDLGDSTFMSDFSAMEASSMMMTPTVASTSRRRPLALPYVHQNSPIPFLNKRHGGGGRASAPRSGLSVASGGVKRGSSPPLSGAPNTPIPYYRGGDEFSKSGDGGSSELDSGSLNNE